MQQTIRHGAVIDALTPTEAEAILQAVRERDSEQRVRASAVIVLDAAGGGQDEVYNVPAGFEFEARRVTLDLDTATDPTTGNVPLNVAGKAVEYLRSGARIEYAVPISPNAVPQVPGVQSWGEQQGPYLRNNETFQVKVRGLTANARLTAVVEGVLRKPHPVK